MSSQKKILLTFDYELFQGKQSGTVQNCMLLPTERILELLTQHKATAVFFIDMMYLYRLKQKAAEYEEARKDFNRIEEQLIKMANSGHYVFNHLHPHWLDACYNPDTNEWILSDDSKYAFASLNESEQEFAFDVTMALLNEILVKAKRYFKPDGYRAGGLYIQPFESFKKHFDKHNIKYEFSVLQNAAGSLQNGKFAFNFSEIAKNIYTFSSDIKQEDIAGTYQEFAMSFIKIPAYTRVLNSIFYRLYSNNKSHKKYGDGISTANPITIADKSKKTSNETFSVEMLNEVKLPLYLNQAINSNYLHLLSHPKLVSDYNLQIFDILLKKLSGIGQVEFDFKKFTQLSQ